jgi:cellulose synthase/poly-beta-1,6-N-acetylglucosamine synthase-like glycosyltransferase
MSADQAFDRPDTMPPVSVFMTVRNEERDLAECVERILGQDYAGEIEVVVAVGPSQDRTREIADDLAAAHPTVTVVDNPTGLTPHGLNAAIGAAKHDYLVRADGHALLPSGYLTRVVSVLRSTGAANVGGRMAPEGRSPFGRAVARAMSSRFGIGGAAFHTGGEPGPQLTVYLGAFRRSALEAVGGYDEHFVRAQDWELNHRLRENGEVVWFLPDLAVTYRPRETWKAFATQQFRTGGDAGEFEDTYTETARPAGRLDLSLNYDLNDQLTLFGDWTNITEEPFQQDFTSARNGQPQAEFVRYKRYDESTFSLGFRFRFGQ